MYRACNACAWRCGVDRLAGERGRCGLTAGTRVARQSLSGGEEGDLSPSHLVYLAGCSFRCVFCLSHAMVDAPTSVAPSPFSQLVDDVIRRRAEGARNVNLLGGDPSVNLLEALELVDAMPPDHPLVWNSNFHHSPETHELLDGVVDTWLADFKFGNDGCAHCLAGVERYVDVVTTNLRRAREGRGRLVVRHLLMPGHLECCTRPVLEHLRANLPDVEVGLTTAFLPLHRAASCPELLETVCFDADALRREYALRPIEATRVATETPAPLGYQGTLFVAADGAVTLMDPSPAVTAWWDR
jgi:putative pyruvate formate lyase activating enzyme